MLRAYVSRRMYLVATADGGSRFDLDGNPVDEVRPQAAGWARAKLADMDARPARQAKKAAEGRAWIEASRAARAAGEDRKAAPALQAPRPVEYGLVATFNRPAGNLTGINVLTNDLRYLRAVLPPLREGRPGCAGVRRWKAVRAFFHVGMRQRPLDLTILSCALARSVGDVGFGSLD
jgi:hypothetical protein